MKNKSSSLNKNVVFASLIIGISLVLSNLVPNILNNNSKEKRQAEISECINKVEGIYYSNIHNACLISGQNDTECKLSKDFLKSIESGREEGKKKCNELSYESLPPNLK